MLDAFVEFLLELLAEGLVWFLLFNSWVWFVISGISWLLFAILDFHTLFWLSIGFSIWWFITLLVPAETKDGTW